VQKPAQVMGILQAHKQNTWNNFEDQRA
jgi:hypothetical protein